MTSRDRPIRPGDPAAPTARAANRTWGTVQKALHRLNANGPFAIDDAMGSLTALEYPKFAIFEIPSSQTSGLGTGWLPGNTSSGDPDNWTYYPNCKRVWYSQDDKTYSPDDTPLDNIWHPVGYPDSHATDLRDLHDTDGLWPAKFGPGDWVWCTFNEQSNRWEVLQAYEDIWRFEAYGSGVPLNGSANVKLVLATPNTKTYVLTDLVFEVVDSLGLGPIEAGARGAAKRFGDSNHWEVITSQGGSTEIVLCTLSGLPPFSTSGSSGTGQSGSSGATDPDTCPGLLPGTYGTCSIYAFDFDSCSYIYLDTGTLHDRHSQNCLFPGESVMAVLRICGEDYHCDILGSHGLERPAKPTGNISCDSFGEIELYAITPPDYVGASSSSSGSQQAASSGIAECDAVGTGCYVDACNTWGATRNLTPSDKIWARYLNGGWHIKSAPYATTARGTLQSEMCDDRPLLSASSSGQAASSSSGTEIPVVTLGSFETTDYCSDLDVTSAENPFHLQGQAGDEVGLKYNMRRLTWEVWQVEHRRETVVVDSYDDGECIYLVYREIAVQRCSEDQTPEALLCGTDCP